MWMQYVIMWLCPISEGCCENTSLNSCVSWCMTCCCFDVRFVGMSGRVGAVMGVEV